MSLELVTFQDKVNINTNPVLPEINKVTDSNVNELKNKFNKGINTINALTYNLVTNGDAVKTGRLIDGKEEYVKRYQMPINSVSGEVNTRAQGSAPLGLNLSAITVTEMNGYVISNTNNVFSLDTSNFNAGNNYTYISYESNEVRVLCNSENYNNTAIINVYFTYNE